MPVAIETILARRSIRRFESDPLSAETVGQLERILAAESVPGPFGSTPRFAYVSAEEMATFGRIGTYGVIRGAPAFIVGAIPDAARSKEDFGYRMEGIILEATALGLGTCWMGGTFNRSAAARFLSLGENETVPAVTPIGHPSGKPWLVDGVFRFVAGSSARLPFERLFYDGSLDRPLTPRGAGPWVEVLECVRQAPSAANRQPWRILLERASEGDRLHLFFAEDRLYNSLVGTAGIQNLDLGIAMRHIADSSAARGYVGSWACIPDPPVSGSYSYVATWS